jgi:hypothetical protein
MRNTSPQGAQHGDLGVFDKEDELGADDLARLPQRYQRLQEQGFHAVVDAEALEDGEDDRQQGHQGEEGGISQAHGPQTELPLGEVAHQGPGEGRESPWPAARG